MGVCLIAQMELTWLAEGEGGGGGGVGSQEAGIGPHFLLQIFFSYFPPLKPRCVLWSSASYSLKNTVNLFGFLFPSWVLNLFLSFQTHNHRRFDSNLSQKNGSTLLGVTTFKLQEPISGNNLQFFKGVSLFSCNCPSDSWVGRTGMPLKRNQEGSINNEKMTHSREMQFKNNRILFQLTS